jgi:hypothetical protein
VNAAVSKLIKIGELSANLQAGVGYWLDSTDTDTLMLITRMTIFSTTFLRRASSSGFPGGFNIVSGNMLITGWY